jgi:hypothetical protein
MVDNESYGTNSLDVTGPSCVGKMVNKYLLRDQNSMFVPGDKKFGLKILSLTFWSNPYITYKGCKLIKTKTENGISERKFCYMSGKEKYTTAWCNKRIYKNKILL